MRAIDRFAQFLAFGAGAGLLPKSPGTFGSLPGLALGYGIHQVAVAANDDIVARCATIAALLLVATGVAYWAIARTEAALHIHDDQRIVVDEVAGQAIAIAFATPSLGAYLVGFVAFRILDIAKPWLIGKIDREVKGAAGTLGDDLVAGLGAAPAALFAAFMLK